MSYIKQYIEFCKKEFAGYPKNIQITLYVLFALVFLFFVFAIQILFWGLGYTNMDNIFVFGQWIIGDLGLVGLGGGAFFTGFFLYIFRNDKLEPLINSTVLIGFLCYLFTLVFLVFDIGQPLRAWFIYTYPNWGPTLMPQSMLTEVAWCLTFYFCVLAVELFPIALKHKILDKNPIIHAIGHYMHRLMWIMAAAGTFLSFFHQGSLGGGMWDVMFAKSQWFRAHHFFFFLAIVGAMAAGPCFMMFCAWLAGKVMKKEVVPMSAYQSLSRISGIMFIVFLVFEVIDVYKMNSAWVPAADRRFVDLWGGYYGLWMLVLEFLFLFGALVILNVRQLREKENYMVAGFGCGIMAITMNKLNVILHGSSVPNFPWKNFASYNPTIQEWSIFLGGVAIMILTYMWCAKYLPLFPHLEKHEHHEGEAHA